MFGIEQLPQATSPYSILIFSTAVFMGLALIQLLRGWMTRRRAEDEAVETEWGSMAPCPECDEMTEAQYRYCRNCASDTGTEYTDDPGVDGSDSSSML
ncbi:MAG: hypothetical protein SV253_09595 [Halobacteria archaeon]|nr:hypothetical protein [Halobacteria archaeon]